MVKYSEKGQGAWRALFARGTLGVGLALTVASCGGIDDAALEGKTEKGGSALFSLHNTVLWNGASADNQASLGTNAVIPVCFAVRPRIQADGTRICPLQTSGNVDCDGYATVNSSVSIAGAGTLNAVALRQRIRSVIEQNWVHAANIEVVNWGDCPLRPDPMDSTKQVHLDSDLARTMVIELRQEFRVPPGSGCTTDASCSSLPFGTCDLDPKSSTFQHCYSRCLSAADCNSNVTPHVVCDTPTRRCVPNAVDYTNGLGMNTSAPLVIHYNWPVLQANPTVNKNIIHEFGHALGFEHEYRRNDGDTSCLNGVSAVGDGLLLTPFPDKNSVMYGCKGTSDVMSPGDIIGVQRAYGRKAQGSLVSSGGMCANIQGGLAAIGTPVVPFPCRNQSNDLWFFDKSVDARGNSNSRLQANPSGAARCLDVSGGGTGGPLVSGACDSGTKEFYFMRVEWHGMGNMCATATQPVDSLAVQMQPCNGSDSQKWNFRNLGSEGGPVMGMIESAAFRKCVSTAGAVGTFGEVLTLQECGGGFNQIFTYPGQGVIALGSLCMNVFGGTTDPGGSIGLWNGCTDNPPPYNSQFSLFGPVNSQDGLCIDSSRSSQLQVLPCWLSPTQNWEYYL